MRMYRLIGVIWAGALCGALLAYGGTVWAEGYILPTAPTVTASGRPVQRGMSRWAFWPTLIAQSASCATQEYGFARFGVYGSHVGTRIRSCALNVGPVLALRWAGKWMRTQDADTAVLPSLPWGVYGTAKNLKDIRTIDRLIKEAR